MQLFNKWTGLRKELAEYMTNNKIAENDFKFLGIYEWKNIYDKVLENFVDGKYARDYGLHWSNIENGFKKDIDRIYDFAYKNEVVINDTYSVGDYYITDKKFNWLITENHHEIVHIIGKGLYLNVIENICTQ